MRRMMTRQAQRTAAVMLFCFVLTACAASPVPPTAAPLPPTPTVTSIPPIPTLEPTATQTACLSQPGRVEQGVLDSTKPPQQYLIYLPPCYDLRTDLRYPVLYLLHGQTYTDDQWVRLGAVTVADRLILSGEAAPFIMVFPDDRYWNLPPGPLFGERLIDALIPHVDETYRTLADRDHRALGGLSRGGGWTVQLGLTHPELFGALGLHSPAIFGADRGSLEDWLRAIPPDPYPRIWLDVGDEDQERGFNTLFESTLAYYGIPHEFHVYSGAHTEAYWSQHVEEYLRWYLAGWTEN